jgi:hypothetical protein
MVRKIVLAALVLLASTQLTLAQCSWELGLGTPTCNGNGTYNVLFSCASGSDPSVNAGSINWSNSTIQNVPVGIDVVITGQLGGCTQSRTRQSPTCDGPPPPPPPSGENLNITGYVGIATTNNGSQKADGEVFRLAVRGRILAEELRVRTGWADDVFLPSYRLATLTEVEKHIQQHGHLPGIPSAAAVEANGIQVGEMNSLLLRKIEELTLHLIRQQKQIDGLKRQPKRRRL